MLIDYLDITKPKTGNKFAKLWLPLDHQRPIFDVTSIFQDGRHPLELQPQNMNIISQSKEKLQ